MANPGVRLLVAENHRLYAEAICQALEREFTVFAAHDAQTLLQAAAKIDSDKRRPGRYRILEIIVHKFNGQRVNISI